MPKTHFQTNTVIRFPSSQSTLCNMDFPSLIIFWETLNTYDDPRRCFEGCHFLLCAPWGPILVACSTWQMCQLLNKFHISHLTSFDRSFDNTWQPYYMLVGINNRENVWKLSVPPVTTQPLFDENMAWAALLLVSLLTLASAAEWSYSKHSCTDLGNLLSFTYRVEPCRYQLDCWFCHLWRAVPVAHQYWHWHYHTGRFQGIPPE